MKTRLSGFWLEFRKSKTGLAGLFLIVAFVFFALFGSYITPFDPKEEMVAAQVAPPEWIRIIPGYADWPTSQVFDVEWTGDTNDDFDTKLKTDAELAEMMKREKVEVWTVLYKGEVPGEKTARSTFGFTHECAPPSAFKCSFRWRVLNLSEMGYNVELSLLKYTGGNINQYSLWDSNFKISSPERSTRYSYWFDVPSVPTGFPEFADLGSGRAVLYSKRLDFENDSSFLNDVFLGADRYELVIDVRLNAETIASFFELQIFDFEFRTLGKVHGILGTDDRGRDVWSRILAGTEVSFIVGMIVATFGTSIGLAVGILSGYLGGFVDEISMRTVDLLMCLPALPLLLAAAEMFGRNIYIAIFIIVITGWMALSRLIRSHVLALREAPFVEAAISIGSTRKHILARHILPNVMHIAFSYLILSVSTAIILEATLSFLGLGDATLISWGRIINEAMVGGALSKDAWWWMFTPGIAICLVCLGFVFVSNAFDKVVNPKLRARR
jgi:peptide/nickel transport system permease protein